MEEGVDAVAKTHWEFAPWIRAESEVVQGRARERRHRGRWGVVIY
jgi:hypothetical protein